jgi:hypothetical protein
VSFSVTKGTMDGNISPLRRSSFWTTGDNIWNLV